MVSYKALNTVLENSTTDFCDGIGDGHRGQTCTAVKSTPTNLGNRVADGDGSQTIAITECILSDFCDRVRNSHRGQTRARSESTIANTHCAFFDGDSRATWHFTLESICHFSYIDNSVGLVVIPLAQPRSAPESITTDFCDGVWDGN